MPIGAKMQKAAIAKPRRSRRGRCNHGFLLVARSRRTALLASLSAFVAINLSSIKDKAATDHLNG
jgi:hypothetical protein